MTITKQVNPQAVVIIWNYADRLNASGPPDGKTGDPFKIAEQIVLAESVVSISTQKSKGQPNGEFEIHLAPTQNWISRITTGSWMAILATTKTEFQKISTDDVGYADERLVKWFGRIESVRVAVDVNESTGAIVTKYVLSGSDWASVFNSKVYIDRTVANSLKRLGPIGSASTLLFNQNLLNWEEIAKTGLPTSSDLTKAMVALWGAPLKSTAGEVLEQTGRLIAPEQNFELPLEVSQYFGFSADTAGGGGISSFVGPLSPATSIGDLIHVITGKLANEDTFKSSGYEEVDESIGLPDPNSLYGVHTFWQVINDNSNSILNEVVADLRFEDGVAQLALYKRIKPFAIRDGALIATDIGFRDATEVNPLVSKFSKIRKIEIDIEDIISCNAGTNNRDRINYIELMIQPSLQKFNDVNQEVKAENQTYDTASFARDGFNPMMLPCKFFKLKFDKSLDPQSTVLWKSLVREWHFNSHLLLNGAISFIGQDKYIQVGDNIMFPEEILSPTHFDSGNTLSNDVAGKKTFILAHVESITHNFTVSDTGARSFVTTVQFVRGITTDESGNHNPLNPGIAIDTSKDSTEGSDHRNPHTFTTPTGQTPTGGVESPGDPPPPPQNGFNDPSIA